MPHFIFISLVFAAAGATTADVDLHGDPLPPGAVARLGTARFRFGDSHLEHLTFSPDGSQLIGVERSGTIYFWEAKTGQLLRRLRIPIWVSGFALSLDGKRIAVGGSTKAPIHKPTTGIVSILDAETGKEVKAFARGEQLTGYCALAFTPDGKLLASIDRENMVRIEKVSSGVEILRRQVAVGHEPRLVMSDGGATIAFGAGQSNPRVWNWQNGGEPIQLETGNIPGYSIALSTNASQLITYGLHQQPVRIWDVATSRLIRTLESREPDPLICLGLAVARDGSILATVSRGKGWQSLLHIWNLKSGERIGRIEINVGGAKQVTISPNARWIATAGENTVRVWEIESGKEVARIDAAHSIMVTSAAALPNGNVVTASRDYTARIWDAATGIQKRTLNHDYAIGAVAVSRDGTRIATAGFDNTNRVWDAKTGEQIHKLAGHGRSGGRRKLAFSNDGLRLYSWGDDFVLRVWNARAGTVVAEHKLIPSEMPAGTDDKAAEMQKRGPMFSEEAAFSPDGTHLVAGVRGDLCVFDSATGKEIHRISRDGGMLASIAISYDNKFLLASAYGKRIEIPLPNGNTRSSTANNHTISLWEISTGKLVKEEILSFGGAGPVTFSPDGKHMAAAINSDGKFQTRRWDVATGEELSAIAGTDGRVSALAYSPDGRRLITGLWDSGVLVWPVPADSKRDRDK